MSISQKYTNPRRFSEKISLKTQIIHGNFRQMDRKNLLNFNRLSLMNKQDEIAHRRAEPNPPFNFNYDNYNMSNNNQEPSMDISCPILSNILKANLQTQNNELLCPISKPDPYSNENQEVGYLKENKLIFANNFYEPGANDYKGIQFNNNFYEPIMKENEKFIHENYYDSSEFKINNIKPFQEINNYQRSPYSNVFISEKKGKPWNENKKDFLTEIKGTDRRKFVEQSNNFAYSSSNKERVHRVGDYEFRKDPDSILGSGTFSTVYRGNHMLNKSFEVAVKVVDTKKCNKNLIDEIYITKSIKSPYVVAIYDYYIDTMKSKCYIILELCNQGSLDNFKFNPNEEISHSNQRLAELYGFFQQIIKGMQPLYNLNIIHRDLKLTNILMKNDQIKISDFGFAKNIGNFAEVNSIKCGTPSTMAPEIMFENKNQALFNKKCDIWSLGIILHELIYGIHPFNYSLSDLQKNKRIKVENKCLMAEDFINRALIYDPKDRMDWSEVFNHPINFLNNDEEFIKLNSGRKNEKKSSFKKNIQDILLFDLKSTFPSKKKELGDDDDKKQVNITKSLSVLIIAMILIYIILNKLFLLIL